MATLQLDLSSANRFVSSLSKSLQALCHGCMNFDTEIEIVGYINVNIDCGSKVDYVLNEKVSKSTNNSMTFVSNSFLAQKDQPKTDRSSSPIPELNVIKNVTHRAGRGAASSSYSSTQLYKSSGIYSPHSQLVKGSQKRTWSGGDWPSPHKKASRNSRSSFESYNLMPTNESSYSSHQNAAFPPPSTSHQSVDNFSVQPELDIKSEVEADESDSAQQQNSLEDIHTNQETNAPVVDINIKSDPDSLETNQLSHASSNDACTSFLNPNATESSNSEVFKTEQNELESLTAGDNGDNYLKNPNDIEISEGATGTDTGFEMTEAGSSNQGFFTGEESGDAQFDIIEIDDEDEDIAAFSDQISVVGNPRKKKGLTNSNFSESNQFASVSSEVPISGTLEYDEGSNRGNIPLCVVDPNSEFCHVCEAKLAPTKQDHQRHINMYHRDARLLPWVCSYCQMGFFSKNGFKDHELKHKGARFPCHVCGFKFTIKGVLKRHLGTVHSLKQCYFCKAFYDFTCNKPHICQ